jgi:hypothetical protein
MTLPSQAMPTSFSGRLVKYLCEASEHKKV